MPILAVASTVKQSNLKNVFFKNYYLKALFVLFYKKVNKDIFLGAFHCRVIQKHPETFNWLITNQLFDPQTVHVKNCSRFK